MMKDTLIQLLETICPGNVFLQGTLAADAVYPDSFITFWTTDTPEEAFYDDESNRVDWYFSVIYYSNDPAKVDSEPQSIINALRQNGFIPQGMGHDIPSDVITHTGWAMEFIYPKNSN